MQELNKYHIHLFNCVHFHHDDIRVLKTILLSITNTDIVNLIVMYQILECIAPQFVVVHIYLYNICSNIYNCK